MKKWEYSPVGVLSMLNDYHMNAYPNDHQIDWKLHYSAEQGSDTYLLVVQYKNPGRLGHLYAKRSISGMAVWRFEQTDNVAGWIKFITDEFDMCRMDIIEMLDEQIVAEQKLVEYGKKIKKQPIHYRQEYPTNDDPFNWRAQYDYKIMSYKDVVDKYGIKGVA